MHRHEINYRLNALKVVSLGALIVSMISLSACQTAWQCKPKAAAEPAPVEAPKEEPVAKPEPTPPAPAALCLDGDLSVYFKFDKSDVSKDDDAKLATLGACLSKNADQKVDAQGWADIRGTDKYNMGLSQRRADAVKKSLEGHGVAGAAITAKGNGETEKFAAGKKEDAYKKNRVVVVKVSR